MSEPEFFAAARSLMRLRNQAPPLLPVPRERDLPLSFGQERLWFLEQLGQSTGAYNLPHAVRLRGPLDRDALAGSFDDVIRRHEALRTTFASSNGRAVQIINAPAKFDLQVEEVSDVPAALERMSTHARHQFDLARGPLFFARLFRLADDDAILFFNVHHIVYDGWSQDILFRELAAFYDARRNGGTARLPELPLQYADYAVWQRQFLDGARAELLGFWKRTLGGKLSAPELPLHASGARRLEVRSMRIENTGRRAFPALLAAFQSVLHAMTGQEDFILCTPVANRNRNELDGIIGYIANLIALRADCSDNPSLQTMIERTTSAVTAAMEHQDLPIQFLSDLDLDGRRLSRVMFAYHNIPGRRLELAGLASTPIAVPAPIPDFDFYLSLERRGRAIDATAKYDASQFDEATAHEVLDRFRETLESETIRRGAAPARQSSSRDDAITMLEAPPVPPVITHQSLTAFLLAHVARLGVPARAADSLADLGCDSLKLIELANQIRTALAIDVPVSDFLKPITIDELAGAFLHRVAAARVLQSGPPSTEAEGEIDLLLL